MNWLDRGNYWLLDVKQLDPLWVKARIARVTGSTAAALIGHSNFSTLDETVDQILGLHKKIQTPIMARGITLEPYARRWLSKTLDEDIEEIGLAVPKWDPKFGASVDGILHDSICEIKIPNVMYKPLIAHRMKLEAGISFHKYYHKHIWNSHYDQMQLCMAVTGKDYCHYTVYLPSDDVSVPEDYYLERVYFNVDYWDRLYAKIVDVYDSVIVPRMEETGITRLDPV